MLNALFESLLPSLSPFYTFGTVIWNLMLKLIGVTVGQTPDTYSQLAWGYVQYEIYPWMLALGQSLLVTFAMIGYLRQAGDIKRDMTLEALVDCGIKLILASALMVSGLDLMQLLFSMAAKLSGGILTSTPVIYMQLDMDVGAFLFYLFFGFLYFMVCLVCAGMIFLAVYGRFLNLYLLVLSAPIAMSTLPGGQGMSQTAYAWLKTFLAKTFEIVLIALAIVIGSRLSNLIDFGHLEGVAGIFDGAIQALQNLSTMVLLTASIKGMDMFMRRTFAL